MVKLLGMWHKINSKPAGNLHFWPGREISGWPTSWKEYANFDAWSSCQL